MDLFSTLTTVVHVVACIFLVIVVLLQSGKGAEVGAVLGGAGSQTVFGGSGGATFLSKLTVWVAVIFMLTSLGLTAFSGKAGSSSVMKGIAPPPIEEAPAAVSEPAAATEPADAATEGDPQ